MSDKPRESFLVPEPVAYCYETPLHGWEIASRAAASAEPELRWRAMVMITDAEREAVTEMAEVCDSRERRSMEFQLPEEAEYWRGRANILRGLLAKHKGGEL